MKRVVGSKVGWLEIIKIEYSPEVNKTYYHCKCSCDENFKVRSDNILKLVEGRVNSDICLNCFQVYKVLPNSTFKWVPDTRYAISIYGEVWSAKRNTFLKVVQDTHGFPVVHLGKNLGLVKLHRMMAKMFVQNPDNLPHVRFKDKNQSNCVVNNLEWYSNMENLAGREFGKLSVTGNFTRGLGTQGFNVVSWQCICECGNSIEVRASDLLTDHIKSCGCLRSEVLQARNFKHGLSGTEEHNVWLGIKSRCSNIESKAAKDYAMRGIIVEEPWNSNFESFLSDMGQRPSGRHTIERLDVNGNYCKENCIWTDDRSLQAYNQRMKSSNTSGRTGVSFYKGRWYAMICGEHIMSSTDYDKAVAAREAAEIERFGFNKE